MIRVAPIERPETLKDLAYKKIKDLLTNGQLVPDTVYSANQFAEVLGVSRTPVREALMQLESEGYLTAVEGRGFRVKPYTEKEIRDFFETRKMIEIHVIRRLAGQITPEDLKQMEASLNQMAESARKGDRSAYLAADLNFHTQLIRRYNNPILESIMQNIRGLIATFGQTALSRKGRVEEVLKEHRRILKALQEGKHLAAIRALSTHLDTTERYLLERLNSPNAGTNPPPPRG